MNYSTAIFLINKNVIAIEAIYDDGKDAEVFKTFDDFDSKINVGDILVVESGTRHKMTTVKVTKVDAQVDLDGPKQVKWVIAKVDKDAFEKNILLPEATAIEKIKSAEMRAKRQALADALLMDKDEMKALPLAAINGDRQAAE
jgi:hypothetical protein